MKRITPKQYAIALYESTKDSEGAELNQRIRNFLELIRKRKNMKSLNKIYQHFVAVYQEREHVLQAEATSSRNLDGKVKNEIIRWLNDFTGCTTTLTEVIDPTLLGGVIVKFNDTVMDASLKNSLKRLQNSFNK